MLTNLSAVLIDEDVFHIVCDILALRGGLLARVLLWPSHRPRGPQVSPRGPHRPHHPGLLGPRGALLGAPPHLLLYQGPLHPVLGPHHRAPVARAPLLGHPCVLDHPRAPVLGRRGPLLGH